MPKLGTPVSGRLPGNGLCQLEVQKITGNAVNTTGCGERDAGFGA